MCIITLSIGLEKYSRVKFIVFLKGNVYYYAFNRLRKIFSCQVHCIFEGECVLLCFHLPKKNILVSSSLYFERVIRVRITPSNQHKNVLLLNSLYFVFLKV